MSSRNRIKRNCVKVLRYLVKASDLHYMTVRQMSIVTGLHRVTDLTRRVQRTNRDREVAEGRGAPHTGHEEWSSVCYTNAFFGSVRRQRLSSPHWSPGFGHPAQAMLIVKAVNLPYAREGSAGDGQSRSASRIGTVNGRWLQGSLAARSRP